MHPDLLPACIHTKKQLCHDFVKALLCKSHSFNLFRKSHLQASTTIGSCSHAQCTHRQVCCKRCGSGQCDFRRFRRPGLMLKLKSLGAGFLGGLATIIRSGLILSSSFGCRLRCNLRVRLLEELLVLPARSGWDRVGVLALHRLK